MVHVLLIMESLMEFFFNQNEFVLPSGVCVMNGQTYTQGQKWFDGCDQTCICNDGKTGAYSCTDRYD